MMAMKLQNCLQLIMVAMGVLVAGQATAASGDTNNIDKIKALDAACPSCVKVANDVMTIRAEHCQLKNTSAEMMISTMRSDPMYGFMLAVDSMVESATYKTILTAAATQVDCGNPQNWIDMTQKELKKITPQKVS
ncbi:hypothetical protein ACET98_19420 [Aeromonas veronii]|uniref:hypothetical protein n=1 Tax=Aeromonas TaxID=642 RepID=UPI000744B38B|nr:hypothetical protein [Aeromonas hydrophila]ALZ82563.1 hypothetical protein AhyD4_23425 [Aeromonas hydrophila]